MKITYNKNPLNTIVELDENEKIKLWQKIKIEQMEELLSDVHFYLEEGEYFNLERAKKAADIDYYFSETEEKSKMDKHCDMCLDYYIEALSSSHAGDCTCVASSCMKCIAEGLIDICTMPSRSKSSAYRIDNAFGKNNENTIEQAIENLANHDINPADYESEGWKTAGGHEQYIEKWADETKVAHDWLVDYKNTHFNDNKNILKTDKKIDFLFVENILYYDGPIVSLGLTKEKIPVLEIWCDFNSDSKINTYAYAFIKSEDLNDFIEGKKSYFNVLKDCEQILTFNDKENDNDFKVIENNYFIKNYGPVEFADLTEKLIKFKIKYDEFVKNLIKNNKPKIK